MAFSRTFRDTQCVDFGFEAIWKVTSSYMPKVLDGPATHVRRHNYKDSNTYSVFIFQCKFEFHTFQSS